MREIGQQFPTRAVPEGKWSFGVLGVGAFEFASSVPVDWFWMGNELALRDGGSF